MSITNLLSELFSSNAGAEPVPVGSIAASANSLAIIGYGPCVLIGESVGDPGICQEPAT